MKNESIIVVEPLKVEVHEKFELRVEIPKSCGSLGEGTVLFNQYGEEPSNITPMKKKEENTKTIYTAEVQLEKVGMYYFFFVFECDGVRRALKLERGTNNPIITSIGTDEPYWMVDVKPFSNPDWAKDKIAYQIFVDRFCKAEGAGSGKEPGRNYRNWGEMPHWQEDENGEFNNNDFFGGNIKGITEKLEYFKSLSVGILYLSPINESLYRYERYASTNHMEIDPDAGCFEELKELHDKANREGIHIILDIAFNHCSSDNPIFQEALNNKNSQYRDWFFIRDDGTYDCWWGYKDMPAFNQSNIGLQNYIYGEKGVVAKFAPYVDGFRLDLAEALNFDFLDGIRKRANSFGKKLIVGECWYEASHEVIRRGLYSPTNYLFTDAILHFVKNGKGDYLKQQVERVLNAYPQDVVDTMITSLDTHDMMRALTILSDRETRQYPIRIWDIDTPPTQWHVVRDGKDIFLTNEFRKYECENDNLAPEEYERAEARLELAIILQYFLPGIPCIYYGTEVGVHGYKDPFNRKCYPWGNEDKKLLEFYRLIGFIRNSQSLKGSKCEVCQADSNVFAFKRENDEECVCVAVNRGDKPVRIDLPIKGASSIYHEKFEGNTLLPYGWIIIQRINRRD